MGNPYKKGQKYFDENGKLLYTEGQVDSSLQAYYIFTGKGSLIEEEEPGDVTISIAYCGLTELGKENMSTVARLKLESIGYYEVTVKSYEIVTQAAYPSKERK